jgi:hypothetical protein
MKILLGDFSAKVFSNRQPGTKVHTKLVMALELE